MAEQWISHALDTLAARMSALGCTPVGYRADGRPIWPVRGGSEPPEGGQGDGGQSGGQGSGDSGKGGGSGDDGKGSGDGKPPKAADHVDEFGERFEFPPDTPIVSMSPAQQTEYWRHKARKHERAASKITPEQLAALREKANKHDALEYELSSDHEKALATKERETRAATLAEAQPQILEARLDAAAARAGVSGEALAEATKLFRDASGALKSDSVGVFSNDDGEIDADKVKVYIESLSPGRGDGDGGRGPRIYGHGSPDKRSGGGGVAAGRDLYNERHHANKSPA